MGNLLNSIAVNAWASGNPLTTPGPEAVGLWDMITYLVKRYIVSKIENDEFLCQHLLNNGSSGTVWNMGQRAITFQPLPSRHESAEEYEGYKEPKIVEYFSESDESTEEFQESIKEEPVDYKLSLYSAYSAIDKNN